MVLAAHFTDAFGSFPNVFTAKEVANIIAHGKALGTAQAGFMAGAP